MSEISLQSLLHKKQLGLISLRRLLAAKKMFILTAIIPVVIYFAVFSYLPILASFIMSFTDLNTFLSKPPQFVGLDNYLRAFRDPLTFVALRNTVAFTIVAVPLGTAVSFVVASMLNSIISLRTFFRTVYFIPVITSMIAVSIMWKWFYQPRFGLINMILGALNLPTQTWLNNPNLALICIVIMSIWKSLGFNAVIFLAGLNGIPREYYDSASVDGANSWDRFLYITLPLLQPTTIFVVVTGIIGNLQVFAQMYVMTQGGPFNSTLTFVYQIYTKAFVEFKGGYSAALAMILFVLVLIVSYNQLRLFRTSWEY